MRIYQYSIITLFLHLIVTLTSCSSSWGPREIINPDVKAGLLIYFKEDASSQEINQFWNDVLSTPSPRGGYKLLPGISGVTANLRVEDHISIRVDFWLDATQEQRDEVKQRITDSPIVYKVLENVVPSSVQSLDQ